MILNELLRAHFNFLAPVRSAWKKHDEFNNGFLNRDKLELVLEDVDADRSFNPQTLAEDIDKDSHDVVTYSSLIGYLAEKTLSGGDNVSLLQHFYDKHN